MRYLLLSIYFPFLMFSQAICQHQYIVKLNGDTIYGKLSINLYQDNSKFMYFKPNDEGMSRIYPYNTKSVYYSKDRIYKSVALNNQRLFMEVKHEGKLSLYTYTRYHSSSTTIITSTVALKHDGQAIEIPSLGFRKAVAEFLRDCPELEQKILNKEYKSRDLQKIANFYDSCEIQDPFLQKVETPELMELDKLRQVIKRSNSLSKKNEALEILIDMERRLQGTDKIPGYLWNALMAAVDEDRQIKKQVEEFKTHLGN